MVDAALARRQGLAQADCIGDMPPERYAHRVRLVSDCRVDINAKALMDLEQVESGILLLSNPVACLLGRQVRRSAEGRSGGIERGTQAFAGLDLLPQLKMERIARACRAPS